jgi:hypothetical protein
MRKHLVVLASLFTVAVLAGLGGAHRARAGVGAAPPVSAEPLQPCGSAAPEALAQAAGTVASRIYGEETSSAETAEDAREIETYTPLLAAVANREPAQAKAAVEALLFSGTHIVRLKVTAGSLTLADVGSRYSLAPIRGVLRLGGRSIGRFLMSVQDDTGYVKLETKEVGYPLVLRVGKSGLPVPGQAQRAPAVIPEHGPVSYRGSRYQSFSFAAQAFPAGALLISLLVAPPAGLTGIPCAEIRSEEMANVAERVARLFVVTPARAATYASLVSYLTGGHVLVRRSGRYLAGTVRVGGGSLPRHGSVELGGSRYVVASFSASSGASPLVVYELVAI